ncbi:hypothetical protein LV82_00427 [Albidovulum inexpectatum]|uniref:Uncharacterized protein n=1 Tax=Albidovulum inexpectatum TaxID=196587 RepID=A0A2S5JM58_9RHOB|nr:hypothetical protein [Albidovulum inexpectatum]PPB82493.1 hypothetical protein LV82_00427 [Albidovulum inexpectatum]
MEWVLLIVAAVLASELILRLPVLAEIRRVADFSRRAGHVLRSSRISDHWKEWVLPRYAWRIGRGSVLFLAMLMIALAPVAMVGLLYPGGLAAWSVALMRPVAMATLCIVSLGYIWLRIRVTHA